jgi:hypothetical protein
LVFSVYQIAMCVCWECGVRRIMLFSVAFSKPE